MNLHETMLFRWMGYWIEDEESAALLANQRPLLPKRSPLDDAQREKYLSLLRRALDPDLGMDVSEYSELDRVGKASPITKPLPCLFFTEQAAVSSSEHWRKYGRMGLGFSKRAVFRRGGRPVIYTGGPNDPVQKAVATLRKHFEFQDGAKGRRERDALEYLVRLMKCTHQPRGTASPKEPQKKSARKPSRGPAEPPRPMQFPKEKRIDFLHEREWRLIMPAKLNAPWHRDEQDRVRFRPGIGTELQLVILPDNETLKMAIDCDEIRPRLIQPNRPPLQLITSELLNRI